MRCGTLVTMTEQDDVLDAPRAGGRPWSVEALWVALPATFLEDYLSVTRVKEGFAEDDAESRKTLLLALGCTMDAFPEATLRQVACWAWVALTGPDLIFPHELPAWAEAFGSAVGDAWVWAAAGLTAAEAAGAAREQAEVLAGLRGVPMPPL